MQKKATLDPVTDELMLVRRSQAGDQDAFARLYDAYIDRIYRYIYFRVADQQVAEDLTSQVFLKVWEKLDTYQAGGAPFVAWLYRIAHNAVIDNYRTQKSSVSIEKVNPLEISYEEGVEESLDLEIESQQLLRGLQKLTDDQQQVLILKFIAQRSTEEIAQQLGKQPGAIRALQMRALQGLARSLNLEAKETNDR